MRKPEGSAGSAPARKADRRWTWLRIAVVSVCLIALPYFAKAIGDLALISLATRMAIYAIAAASLNLILGYGGLVSFGHAAFFGVGGYVVGILYSHFVSGDPFLGFVPGSDQLLVTLPLAVVLSGVVALVLGSLSLRTSGVQFIMITLAFAQMLFFLFVSLKYYGGDDGLIVRRRNSLPGLDLRDDTTFYFVCVPSRSPISGSAQSWCDRGSAWCSGASVRTSGAWRRSASPPIPTSSRPSSLPAWARGWPARWRRISPASSARKCCTGPSRASS